VILGQNHSEINLQKKICFVVALRRYRHGACECAASGAKGCLVIKERVCMFVRGWWGVGAMFTLQTTFAPVSLPVGRAWRAMRMIFLWLS
jgi:hypothetical protein